jgi:hypothetical protein
VRRQQLAQHASDRRIILDDEHGVPMLRLFHLRRAGANAIPTAQSQEI